MEKKALHLNKPRIRLKERNNKPLTSGQESINNRTENGDDLICKLAGLQITGHS